MTQELLQRYLKRWFPLPDVAKYHPEQVRMHNSECRFQVVPAGRRSFKTERKKRKLVIGTPTLPGALTRDDSNFFFGAPTRMQAKRIAWKDLKDLTKAFWSSQPSETELVISLINGSQIHVTGMDEPARIEGSQWHGGVLDEFGNMKEDTWNEHIQPVTIDTNAWIDFIGVPEGRNHYYDLALYALSKVDPEWDLFTWKSSDVIDKKFIEQAKMQLDERSFKQEYEASFEETSGRAYWAYDEKNHSDMKFLPDADTHLCFDFNVNPMVVLVNQMTGQDVWTFTKEFTLRNTNTYEMVDAIYGFLKDNFHGKLEITGDYSGNQRRGSATLTDWTIIKNKFYGNWGFEREVIRVTKSIKDRVNHLNARLRNAEGEIRQFVNNKECPMLHNDLLRVELVVLPNGDTKLDDSNPNLTHASDAASYEAYNFHKILLYNTMVN